MWHVLKKELYDVRIDKIAEITEPVTYCGLSGLAAVADKNSLIDEYYVDTNTMIVCLGCLIGRLTNIAE